MPKIIIEIEKCTECKYLDNFRVDDTEVNPEERYKYNFICTKNNRNLLSNVDWNKHTDIMIPRNCPALYDLCLESHVADLVSLAENC